MKIAFDHQIFTSQSYGGVSRYFSFLAGELIKQGQDARVYAGLHLNNYLSVLPNNAVSGIKVNRYPLKSARLFQWLNHAFSQVAMNKWKPDIIHETYYSDKPVLKSSAFRVTTVYDMIHELYPDEFSPRNKTKKRKIRTFDRVDHIISISESTKRDLIQLFGIDKNKISVVHLGVDLTYFQENTSYQPVSGKPIILYVGGRRGYKNFNGFVRAFASSPKLMSGFDIVAFGGCTFSEAECLMFKKLGFQPRQVRQVGGSDKVLAELYHQATAFVFPSLYEGFGLPPLEAMAAGCPVVSSNTSSIPEVVRDAGEYFDPNNHEEMRNAIENVVFSDTRKQQLKQLGFNNIENFSWYKCATDTLDVYKRLTNKI